MESLSQKLTFPLLVKKFHPEFYVTRKFTSVFTGDRHLSLPSALSFQSTSDLIYWKSTLLQGESLARGPKLLSTNNYVIEIMIWKFIYTYREWSKTGSAHNRCWNWSPFTSKHTWMRFSKFWNTFPKVSTLTVWIAWLIASLSCSIVRGVFLYTLPFNRPKRKKSAGVRSASPCL